MIINESNNRKIEMDELIQALMIFRKYGNPDRPTHCEHDTMYISIDPADVSEQDLAELDRLGFSPDSDNDEVFSSYRFGSA